MVRCLQDLEDVPEETREGEPADIEHDSSVKTGTHHLSGLIRGSTRPAKMVRCLQDLEDVSEETKEANMQI